MPHDLLWLRCLLGAMALALAAIAAPMTAADALRTAAGEGAPSPQTIHAEAALGWLRGDLWGAYAMTEATPADAADDAARQAFRRAARSALSYAPYQPLLWLRLGQLETRDPQPATPFNALVKMAYDTAPADGPGLADRLGLALSASGSPDEELDELARSDVRALLAHDRLSELSTVYRSLGAGARAFVERAVKSIRPDLAARLGAAD